MSPGLLTKIPLRNKINCSNEYREEEEVED
jgi:hypothetical protein